MSPQSGDSRSRVGALDAASGSLGAQHHFLALEGAAHLHTPSWLLGREGVLEAVRERAIASVTGVPGTGKSYLLNTVVPEIDIPVQRVEFGHRPTMLSISKDLMSQLTGEVPRGNKRDLIPALRDALRGPLAVVVDEAQRLNRECLDHLRFLHDHSATEFALILAGGEGCWEVLGSDPQLRRRIYRPCFFHPLSQEEIESFVPRFHPVWEAFTSGQIAHVDAEYGKGLLGHWAAATKTMTDLTQRGLSGDDAIQTALYKHGVI